MPATADPVSWQAGAITTVLAMPTAGPTSACIFPSTVPASTILGNFSRLSPKAAVSSFDQDLARTSSICVVLASVYSAAAMPVKRYWKYSGSVSQSAARSHSPGNSSTCASNWKSVLKGMNWIPVIS